MMPGVTHMAGGPGLGQGFSSVVYGQRQPQSGYKGARAGARVLVLWNHHASVAVASQPHSALMWRDLTHNGTEPQQHQKDE
jgi:hypothetical protein